MAYQPPTIEDARTTIDLKDLFAYLLVRWKSLAAMVLAAVLALVGLTFLQAEPTAPLDAASEAVRAAGVTLDDLSAMETAAAATEEYRRQLAYQNDSLLMRLDPDALYEGELHYYLVAGGDVRMLGTFLSGIVDDAALLDELGAVLGGLEPRYVRELLSAGLSVDEADAYGILAEEYRRGAMLQFQVLAPEEASCASLLDVIQAYIKRLQAENAALFEGSQLNLYKRAEILTNDPGVRTSQQNAQTALNENLSSASSVINGFSEKKLDFYNEVFLAGLLPDGDLLSWYHGIPESPESLPKRVILGVLLGGVLWLGLWFLRFYTDPRLRSLEVITHGYRLTLVARLTEERRKPHGLNALARRLVTSGLPPACDISYAGALLALLNRPSVAVCADWQDGKLAALAEALAAACPGAFAADLMQNSEEALRQVKAAGNVVFMVHEGATTHAQLRRELELCGFQEIEALGFVSVEDGKR